MFKKNYLLTFSLLSLSATGLATEKNAKEASKSQEEIVIKVNDQNFESVVLKAEKPVIVDFWADWCPPCKAFKPVFAQLAQEHSNDYIFASIDLDKSKELAIKHKVSSIPTILIFKDGIVKGTLVGGIAPENFTTEVKKALEAEKPITNAPQMPQDMLFLQAINMGNIAQVKDLINDGFDVNHVFMLPMPIGADKGKEMQFTPLSSALSLQNKEMVTFLLDSGASLDQKFKTVNGTIVTAREFIQYSMDETVKNGKEMLAFLDEKTKQKK